MSTQQRIKAIDSHTGGEPTRVVISGFPDLGRRTDGGTVERFRRDHDDLRAAIVREPRGHDAVVGALLCEPVDSAGRRRCDLLQQRRLSRACAATARSDWCEPWNTWAGSRPGNHLIETPVGTIEAELEADGHVSITNVPSYRFAKDVAVNVDGSGSCTRRCRMGR